MRRYSKSMDIPAQPPSGRPAKSSLRALAPFAPPVAIFVVAFSIYLLTMAPTVFGLDSAEFSATAFNLGVPHATGYPLYILLGKLFTWLPVGDVGYRLNLMSGVFGALTAGVAYGIALLITHRVFPSMAAAAFLAFSFYFWSSSVVAEVYTLHALLTAIVIYLILQWEKRGDNRFLYAGCFLWGLSFGNHMATAFLGPGLAYLVLSALWQGRIRWRHVAIAAAFFIPALGIYAYIPLRYAANAWPYALGEFNAAGEFVRTNFFTFQGAWGTLTAEQFDTFMWAHRGLDYLQELGRSLWWLLANFLGVGIVLGGLGLLRSWGTDRRRLIFLGSTVVVNLLFFASYGAPDKQAMLLAVYLIWALWLAEGIAFALGRMEHNGPRWPTWTSPLGRYLKPGMAFLLLPALALGINFSFADVSSDTSIRDRYTQVLTLLEPNALVLAWWPDSSPMLYFQVAEAMRQDVKIVDRYLMSVDNERKLLESRIGKQPVYIFGHVPPLNVGHEAVPIPGPGVLFHRLLPGAALDY